MTGPGRHNFQQHRSEDDAGDPIDAGLVPTADGSSGWTFEASGVTLSDDTPLVESGSGDPGAATDASRSDHVHPDDGGGGGGGGGYTQSFVGYNTVGGSFESLTNDRQLMKKITLSSTTHFRSIDVHIKATNTDPTSVRVGVLADVAGSPTLVLAGGILSSLGIKGGTAARWVSVPITPTLAAGDYWLAVTISIGASVMQMAYDTSGSDVYVTVGPYVLDGDYTSTTNSTRKYSIRASILS